MRKINLLLLVLLLVVTSCSNEEQDFIVGKESKNLEDITHVKLYDLVDNQENLVSTDYLKQKWAAEFNEDFTLNKIHFTSFEVLKSLNVETRESIFFLKVTSSDKTVEHGVFLRKIGANKYAIN
ncbi:lipoprotein [Bizionia myxarmorum]|uniref:Type IV secretion system putative lipoprotein virB7 n=1 Tax=Bizionia myxarmorum TaxID=291186 RepID=A0A5D0REU3_9FLAO|nr:lipoprotein [Bizionia myxarmorum]TYB79451.1 hypothetical protein ES674_06725 [Bizionia myxarmorum]